MVSVDLEPVVGLVAVVTVPAAALAAVFVGLQAAAVIAIVGWLFLVPVLSGWQVGHSPEALPVDANLGRRRDA